MVGNSIQKTDPKIAQRMADRVNNNSHIYESASGEYSLAFDKKRGKALVPIYPTTLVARKLKDRIRTGERREDNIEIYEKAAFAEPMVWRSVLLIAKWSVAWGYTFGFINKFSKKKKSSKETNETLEFYSNWAEYVYLTWNIFRIVVSMVIYGDAFIEKIYDDNGSRLAGGTGWGIRHIKHLHTQTIAPERDEYGRVKMYWQKPPTYFGRNMHKIKKFGGIPLDPATIIHFKWNEFRNKTYGISDLKASVDAISMKVGIREDAAIMVQQRSNPIVAWLVGDIDNPPPAGFLAAAANYLSSNAEGDNDFVLPGFMVPHVVGTGEAMPDLTTYIKLFSSEIVKGIGVPEVLLGEGQETTEATARIQIESFVGDIMYLQNYISDKLRRECFRDIIDTPVRKRSDRREIKDREYVPYETFIKIPSMIANPIVSNERMMELSGGLYEKGLLSTEEARERIGELSVISPSGLSPTVKAIEAEIKNAARDLDIRVEEMHSNEKIAEKQAKAQAKARAQTSSPAKTPTKTPAKKKATQTYSFP